MLWYNFKFQKKKSFQTNIFQGIHIRSLQPLNLQETLFQCFLAYSNEILAIRSLVAFMWQCRENHVHRSCPLERSWASIMVRGNAPLVLEGQELLDDLAPSHFQLSRPLTLHEPRTQQGGVKWVEEPVQLGVISNQGPALKGSGRLRVSDRLGSVHHLEEKRLSKLDFKKEDFVEIPFLKIQTWTVMLFSKWVLPFWEQGQTDTFPGQSLAIMDQSLAPGAGPAQEPV